MSLPVSGAAGFQGHPARKRARGRNHKQAGISYNQKYYFRLLALMGKNAASLAPPPPSFSGSGRSVKAIAPGLKERPKLRPARGLQGPAWWGCTSRHWDWGWGCLAYLLSPFLPGVNWRSPFFRSLPCVLGPPHLYLAHQPSVLILLHI